MSQPSIVPRPLSSGPSDPDGYRFPDHRLRLQLRQPDRTPLVLIAPGSFSPITFLHLRMFEMAADYVRFNTNFELIGGYLSPVSDSYRKKGLAPHEHRLQMCELAADQTSKWLMVDRWEATQPTYMRTALVLKHFEDELKRKYPDTAVRIALLAGADLVQTMSQPGVWDPDDLSLILGKFGLFVVERDSTDMNLALAGLPQGANINVIPQVFINNMSSTQVRLHLQRNMSVRYLIPDCVIDYIEQHGLYQKDDNKGRERADLRAITSSENREQVVGVAPVTGS